MLVCIQFEFYICKLLHLYSIEMYLQAQLTKNVSILLATNYQGEHYTLLLGQHPDYNAYT